MRGRGFHKELCARKSYFISFDSSNAPLWERVFECVAKT